MQEFEILKELVIILGIAVIVVAVFSKFRLPAIAGFILAGILVGPEVLGIIGDVHNVEILAEIGVALLLFGIGMELSLEKLKRLWRLVVFGGLIQVSLSILVAVAIADFFGLPLGTSIFVGFMVAISSTAIVLRGLEQRGEIDAPHGRLVLGILVFQDLCVVPMMLAIPLLSGQGSSTAAVLSTLGWSVLILAGVLIAARLLVPKFLALIARTRQRHLFILTTFVISIGTAWVATQSGVSLALGAFLAGLVVADSEYRHQALADLTAFREIFASLFFVSVGMLLAPSAIASNIQTILLILAAILIGKFIIVFLTAAVLRLPLRVCALAAVSLFQVGEFSFVLARAADGTGLLPGSLEINILAAAILSMLITPFALSWGPKIAAGVGRIKVLHRVLDVAPVEEAPQASLGSRNHVIIGGFGIAGQELAKALEAAGVPYIIIELNSENVRRAKKMGMPAFFGDITSVEVLEHLGIAEARELVLVINDPSATARAVKSARMIAPNLYIVARTNYLLDVEPLMNAGASQVIPAEVEAAAEVIAQVLGRHGVPEQTIDRACDETRSRISEEEPEQPKAPVNRSGV